MWRYLLILKCLLERQKTIGVFSRDGRHWRAKYLQTHSILLILTLVGNIQNYPSNLLEPGSTHISENPSCPHITPMHHSQARLQPRPLLCPSGAKCCNFPGNSPTNHHAQLCVISRLTDSPIPLYNGATLCSWARCQAHPTPCYRYSSATAYTRDVS